MEAREDEEVDRTRAAFSNSKAHIEIIGISSNKAEAFTFEVDRKTIHFLLRDTFSKEVVPCYVKRKKVFVCVNDFVEKPFIIYNTTENTIDFHLTGDAIEVSVDEVSEEELEFEQIESEYLRSFLASINSLAE